MKIRFKHKENEYTIINDYADFEKLLIENHADFEIKFERENIIGLAEVKNFLEFYKKLLLYAPQYGKDKPLTGELNIFLLNGIKNFDITFIAALNLFKFSFEQITIRLFFHKPTKNTEEEESFFRLGQLATTGYLTYGREIFGIVIDGKRVNPVFFLKNLSGYLPFFYLNESQFDQLFQHSIKDSWNNWWENLKPVNVKEMSKLPNTAEDIYQNIRTTIIKNLSFTGDPRKNSTNYHVLFLFYALRQIHFIRRIFKNQIRNSKYFKSFNEKNDPRTALLGIGLSREADHEYEEQVNVIFNNILEKPPAFVMLFSYFIEVFYTPIIPPNATYPEKIKHRVDLITSIFYFTDEIFYGVRELAKNIIEHSSNHRGVIIGRALNRENLAKLKPGIFIENYLTRRPGSEKQFIDFIVLDDGNRGIIEQTIINVENLEEKFKEYPELQEKFKEDSQNLKKGVIHLEDFFNPEAIKLKYQEIRSALSLGLLIFSHLVLENNGYMLVSSPHQKKVPGMVLYNSWQDRKTINEIAPLGTFYNILFPKNLERPPSPRNETIPFEMPSGESAFITLIKQMLNCPGFERINAESEKRNSFKEKLCFIEHVFQTEIHREEINQVLKKLRDCEKCSLCGNRKILSLDMKNIFKFDPSDLFRFLAKIQMVKDLKSIIVHGVKEDTISRILEIFKIFRRMGRKIGSKDHYVLFYYQPSENIKKYYSFLLAGETWEDVIWINEKIEKTTYTQKSIAKEDEKIHNNITAEFKRDYYLNPLFTQQGHLLPFDVMIRTGGLTLFERNVLSNLLAPGMHATSPSYKFDDAHMRLGSKIHLKDFFYARRIFQDSFYSLRFAYLVYQYIHKNADEWSPEIKNDNFPVTILGYGLYSELLISNVTRFLQDMRKNWSINHAVIKDAEELEILGSINPNIIVVIPISSTLSTSHKIEMTLTRRTEKNKVLGNPINLMIVGNGDMKTITGEEGVITDDVARHFWKHMDSEHKIITTFSPEKKEKFFLYLPSKWYLPQNCELCFPSTPVDETVLFEADKVSVTPSLIFELPVPKGRTELSVDLYFGDPGSETEKIQNKANALITKEMLIYGHTIRSSNHYLYYIKTTDFLKRNEEILKNWLLTIKQKLSSINGLFNSKIILIAPTHFTNADFINRVNEIVFNDVATLFHYDQDEDYIQNLKSFFGQDIREDAYVFFIDDAMCGGSTFEKINNFVKYSRSGTKSRGVDGVFVLLNRLMQDKYVVIMKELERVGFFAFVDIEASIMIDSEKFCHLCSEKIIYEKMLSESVLDSLRVLIKAKIMKLKEIKYEEIEKNESTRYPNPDLKYLKKEKLWFSNPINNRNYLKRLEYVHKFYRAFSDENVKNNITYILKETKNLELLCKEANIRYGDDNKSSTTLSLDEKVDLIKVLANPYFVYHKEIRKYIFKIVLKELESAIRELSAIPTDQSFVPQNIETYRYLKFLIKRAAALKANYIIRSDILRRILILYSTLKTRILDQENRMIEGGLYSLSLEKINYFKENLDGFVDYYTMAAKEVSWYNEARSLRLEQTLKKLQEDKDINGESLVLTHSLCIENISIPIRFLLSIENQIDKIGSGLSHSIQDFRKDIELLSTSVLNYFKDDPYRSSWMLYFLGFEKNDFIENYKSSDVAQFLESNSTFQKKILPMILLKSFFLSEKKENKANRIQSAMDYILFCLCRILDIEMDNGGAFFVVKHIKSNGDSSGENLFNIGHIGKHKDIDAIDWENSITKKVFKGYLTSFNPLPLTYVQIQKKKNQFYTHYDEKIDGEIFIEFEKLKDMKNFLFLRIADDDLDSTARGMVVFYSDKPTLVKPEDLRYAMILKKELFEFIEKNYEKYSFTLYEEKKSQLKELEAINKVIAKITSAADLNEVYEAVKNTATNFPQINELCLLTHKYDEYEPVIKCINNIGKDCNVCKLEKLACMYRDHDYSFYYSPDAYQRKSADGFCNKANAETIFIIPLVFENNLLGILYIESRKKEAFTTFERNLLLTLAAQVAIAINNRIKQDKQEEIFRDISHSMGTYLTTMSAYTQRLIEGKVKVEAKQNIYLKMLYGDIFSLINAVNEISSLTRLEDWDQSSISESVEINEILKYIVDKNKFLLEEKDLKVKIAAAEENLFIKADKQRFTEAIQSILNNAIKFSDIGKRIDIRLYRDFKYNVIEVADQGFGIPKDEIETIFKKYVRGSNAKEKQIPGTGIGLTVAKNIIIKHSGIITVESIMGKGSTFIIKLPIFIEKTEE